MKIVIITIPGEAHKAFVNTLQRETHGAVELVIIQSPKRIPLLQRVIRFYQRASGVSFFTEAWYALLLRLRPKVRKALTYFQAAGGNRDESYAPKVIWSDSVNSDEVFATLQSLAPDILVVWGSTVLEPRILATAKRAVNLHFGYSPYYRGALANQHAVLNEEYEYIGATIHYIHGKVDGGDILDQLRINPALPLPEALTHLTTEAPKRFIEIVRKLHLGETLPARTQDTKDSKVLLLKHWLPSLRYTVGTRLCTLEQKRQTTAPTQHTYRFAALALIAAIVFTGSYALTSGLLRSSDVRADTETLRE